MDNDEQLIINYLNNMVFKIENSRIHISEVNILVETQIAKNRIDNNIIEGDSIKTLTIRYREK